MEEKSNGGINMGDVGVYKHNCMFCGRRLIDPKDKREKICDVCQRARSRGTVEHNYYLCPNCKTYQRKPNKCDKCGCFISRDSNSVEFIPKPPPIISESRAKMLDYIRNNPDVTAKQISKALDMPLRYVRFAIQDMKKYGHIYSIHKISNEYKYRIKESD